MFSIKIFNQLSGVTLFSSGNQGEEINCTPFTTKLSFHEGTAELNKKYEQE